MFTTTCRMSIAIALALALGGCATSPARSYVATVVPPHPHRTYAWAQGPPKATGDPRLDSNRFFEERVEAAVDGALRSRGFVKGDTPELVVKYHASVIQDVYVSGAEQSEGRTGLSVYDKGTLVIDLADAANDRLLWRGWAEDAVDGVVDDQRLMEQRIDDAVARIMKRLPTTF
jgi:hypothetical protein